MSTLDHLRSQIEFHRAALLGSIRTSAEHAKRLGELLLDVQKIVGHGGFDEWVERNCSFKPRTARAYKQVARSKRQNAAASIRQILEAERAPGQGVAADQLPLAFDFEPLPPPTVARLRYIERERDFPDIVKKARKTVPRFFRAIIEASLRQDSGRFFRGEPGNLVEAFIRDSGSNVDFEEAA